MSYGSPDPYGGGSPAPSPAAFDAPSPAVSINSATGRPLKGKGSRGPYKKRKRDGQGSGGATGTSSAGGQHLYDDFADGLGPADGGRGELPAAAARRDSNAPPWSIGPPGGRSARASTPAAAPSRRGTAGPSTPAPTPGPSGGLRDDEDEDEDVVDDEDELARLDGGDGEGGEGEQQGEVRRRIQRVKEDQILLTEHMSAAQRERFDAWKVASFNRQAVKRHITQTTSNTITDDMAQIIGGVAKVFVGQVMSTARRIQQERGDVGPLAPAHLREAYRLMSASTAGVGGRAVGMGKKRRLFAR